MEDFTFVGDIFVSVGFFPDKFIRDTPTDTSMTAKMASGLIFNGTSKNSKLEANKAVRGWLRLEHYGYGRPHAQNFGPGTGRVEKEGDGPPMQF
jgi:hypothetical protein